MFDIGFHIGDDDDEFVGPILLLMCYFILLFIHYHAYATFIVNIPT